jgi:hypothetical protein
MKVNIFESPCMLRIQVLVLQVSLAWVCQVFAD